ncbi:DNA-binding response regulator [Viridibacillus sp. FSL H7-0596]|uniref:response regulator transcription factor n=1 Tax=Viridibacillus sp. FSL H7-0596 TaxID=1928923 RepID=UPI00096C08F6|nr:response regulator transcription factor [Viridibacillus sp. FSL H7-0596]OMC86513.1 DNA-binding response regulator [Viridibacillus sp. FSL H7-0596]
MVQSINILVVEDDNDINQLLCHIVEKSGYVSQSAFSGTEAMIYLEKQDWDMVLLDLMLPGMNGDEILSKIAERSNMPVLIISAKLEQQTKINALRSGADDYITKPFDIDEVSARIDSHLRRYRRMHEFSTNKELMHKELIINTEAKKAVVEGKLIAFTAREYDILVLLMSSPNKIFTKENLFERVWNEPFYGEDNIINVHMSNIRSKLSKVNPGVEYIETIWGMGYRLKT